MLQLNVNRTRGRAAKPVAGTEVRALTQADLALLATEKGVASTPIKRLRDSHHALARALAVGCTPAQAQLITGYSNSRISILQADPAFQELVAHYQGLESEVHGDMVDRMRTFGLDCVAELQERLDESPDDFSPSFLLEAAKTMADRTGAGPKSTQTNVNVNVNYADAIRAARERAARSAPPLEAGETKPILDLTPLPAVATPPAPAGEEEPGA